MTPDTCSLAFAAEALAWPREGSFERVVVKWGFVRTALGLPFIWPEGWV